MATRRQVHLDATLIGPAPKRVGIDADQPAGRSEGQPVAIGVGSDRHTGLELGRDVDDRPSAGGTLGPAADTLVAAANLGESGYPRFVQAGGG